MMPDRIVGTPKRAAYFILFLALIVLAEGVWVNHLNGRLNTSERVGREVGCPLLASINDVAVEIPLQNINGLLRNLKLTPQERQVRLAARARYVAAQKQFAPSLQRCAR